MNSGEVEVKKENTYINKSMVRAQFISVEMNLVNFKENLHVYNQFQDIHRNNEEMQLSQRVIKKEVIDLADTMDLMA